MPDGKLQRAREHCFMAGVNDTAMELCQANVPYGLAKIHHVQEQLGVAPDATFVGTPDATVTRNSVRWGQGFGYGGMYAWSGDFTVLDIKPNACGMIVGALPDLPAVDELRARLRALDDEELTLDGVALDNDLTESNHFVDVLEVAEPDNPAQAEAARACGLPGLLDGARYLYIMHSSGHTFRGSTGQGPGLYWDQSEELRALARRFDTPWGSVRILTGERADEWYRFYLGVQDFNHRRRELLADYLFRDHRVIINATHQGLVRGYDRANIGCYTFDDPAPARAPTDDAGDRRAPIFPLTLSPDLPAFLVHGKRNVGDAAIDALGWRERLDRHGLMERVAGSNVLPHGAGYTYPSYRGVARVLGDGDDDRRFELTPAEPGAEPAVIATPRSLPYEYRGLEVKERMEELDLGDVVARLDLLYVLTA